MNPTRSPGKAPVSTHPLFPAIVALWFAALLGLGSMILPNVLLERLVTVTGLSSVLPMAAPPLGFTARAMLALAAAGVGAIFGTLLARRVAESHAPRPKARFTAGPQTARKPISAHDELGGGGIGSNNFAAVAQKRRTLALAEEGQRSAFLQNVPLPGDGEHAIPPADDTDDALELGEFVDGPEPDTEFDQDDTMTEGTRFTPPQPADDYADDEDFGTSRPIMEDEDEEDAAGPEALHFDAPSLRRRQETPAFLANYDFDEDDDEPVESDFVANPFATASRPFEQAAEAPRQAMPAQPQFVVVEPEPDLAAAIAAGVDDRPLDDLGLVQLAARLGASIERRRAMRANALQGQVNRPAPVFAANPEDFDAAAAEDAARARASFFAPVAAEPELADMPAIPEAYEPEPAEAEEAEDVRPLLATKPSPIRDISFDEDEDGEESDLAASLSFPRAGVNRSFETPFTDESHAGEDEEEEEDNSDFSSLLAMTNPFQKKAEFVRIEEPEPEEDEPEAAVTFPTLRRAESEVARPFDPPVSRSQGAVAPADPGDADRDLRAALATLQRMSGAA